MDTQRSAKQIDRIEFDDILKPEETIGGVAEKSYFNRQLEDTLRARIPELNATLPPMYIVGITDRNTGEPKGVVYYVEGPRNKGDRKPAKLPVLQTQTQEMTI